ncbi:MAG TPA: VOC family protein [Gemmatimonadota bacterium]|nr:VOC family protein [Gemmatimonadota bacterium]
MSALRLAALTLTAPDLRESERFYRWCLDLKPDGENTGDRRELSWGREDRVLLARPDGPAGEEALRLRMPAGPLDEVAGWCRETGLDPETVRVPPEDEAAARQAWPSHPVEIQADDRAANRIDLRVRAPGGLVLELVFPLPAPALVERGRRGPFSMRSGDRSGLEIPGLLGVRTGVPDPGALREFAAGLGARPMSDAEFEPLAVGDHQWIVEGRESPGVYGFAVVVSAARLGAVERTLAHMEVEHRLDGQRLLTVDPGGRIILIHGLRQG